MPLTPNHVTRAVDSVGTRIKSFTTAGGEEVQGVVITDEDGNAAGIPTNPTAVELRNSGGTEIGTAADPVEVGLRNSAGTEIGTAADPVEVGLRNSAGTEIGTAADPVEVGLRDSSGTELATDAAPLKTAVPRPATTYTSGTLEDTAQAKATAGVLREITITMDSTATGPRYLQIHDINGAATGAPAVALPIPDGAVAVHYEPVGGMSFSAGIRVSSSSTLATYTASGDSLAFFKVRMD